MALFRLVQISDLHFSSSPYRLNPLEIVATSKADMARAVLRDMYGRKLRGGFFQTFYPSSFNPDVAASLLETLVDELVQADAVIVTGDLGTTGSAEDLKLAKDFFSGAVSSYWNPGPNPLPSLLERPDDIVVTLPGNHDRYEGVALVPGGLSYEQYFGRSWDFGRGHSYDLLSPAGDSRTKVCTLYKEEVGLAVCLADFSLETAASAQGYTGYIGQGRVSKRVLDELLGATEQVQWEAREAGVHAECVWAVHFPPCFPAIDDALRLIAGEDLLAASASRDVRLLMAGHTHQPLMYQVTTLSDGTVLCGGSSTGMCEDGLFSYSRIDLTVERDRPLSVDTCHFTWDSDSHTFVVRGPLPNQGC